MKFPGGAGPLHQVAGDEVRASAGGVAEAQDAERRKLEPNLHDGARCGRDMPGRRAADPAQLGARIPESCRLWFYNSQVLANATGLGCNCSDAVLTSRRTHMSGMSPEVSVNE